MCSGVFYRKEIILTVGTHAATVALFWRETDHGYAPHCFILFVCLYQIAILKHIKCDYTQQLEHVSEWSVCVCVYVRDGWRW